MIDNSRQAVYGYDQRVEAFGSAGMAALGQPARAHGASCATPTARAAPPLPVLLPRALHARATCASWAAFVEAVRRGGPPPVAGADGRAALVIGLAASRSLREGRPVRVAEIDG